MKLKFILEKDFFLRQTRSRILLCDLQPFVPKVVKAARTLGLKTRNDWREERLLKIRRKENQCLSHSFE